MNQILPLSRAVSELPRVSVRLPANDGTGLSDRPDGAGSTAPQSRTGQLSAELRKRTRDYEWLLLLRFALVNAFALALAAAAWVAGYVDMVLARDDSGVSHVIALVFVMGWAFGCRAALTISRDLNRARRGGEGLPREPVENLKERLAGRIAIVRHTANALVLLGLIGTVIGFIVALSGVKPGDAGDASAIGPMVATLIHGMSVALYTTLVGSVFALWLTVLYRMLGTASSKLLCAARLAAHA